MTTDHPALQLFRDRIGAISEQVYAASWMDGCEWDVWAALTEWRAGRPALWWHTDLADHMPALDWLHRHAQGWVWWLDGPVFVPDVQWEWLVAERGREQISNERLHIRLQTSGPRGR